ncbi:MAG TPA: beta-N-acetylhexosaminidase, partial [Trueperaceae bacterium]
MPDRQDQPSHTDRLPLMIDLSSTSLTPDERELLREGRVSGVCLFGRNVTDRGQVADYVAQLRSLAGEDLVVAIDQEGGGVVRLFDVPVPPAAMALGFADDPDLTREVAMAAARGMRAVGVNLDFAPVADVNSNPLNPVIADRSFGSDPESVARHVAAFVRGLQAEGVGATIKHFPGHGDTDVDSHLDLPTVDGPLEELRRVELPPFAAGVRAGVAAVMSAHIVLPAIDAQRPATLSSAALNGLLRGELGFDGVIATDALDMRAISDRWPAPVAAVMSLQAGADLPLVIGAVASHRATLDAIEQAAEEGVVDLAGPRRRLAELSRRFPGHAPDPDAAWREGDEELLAEAARRGLAQRGELPRLKPGETVLLLARNEVRASAAAQVTVRPAAPLKRFLEEAGVHVRHVDVETASPEEMPALLQGVDAAVYASTTRVRPPEPEL